MRNLGAVLKEVIAGLTRNPIKTIPVYISGLRVKPAMTKQRKRLLRRLRTMQGEWRCGKKSKMAGGMNFRFWGGES